MASLALGVKFTAASAGAGSFVYAAAVTGYLPPAAPYMVNGKTYRYRAENPLSPSEWEWGTAVYTLSTGTFTRTVAFSSTGGTVAFTGIPQVGIIPFPADILQFDDAMSLTTAQQQQALVNLGIGAAWTAYTPSASAAAGSLGVGAVAAGSYSLVGKTLFLQAGVTTGTGCTASGGINLGLPLGLTAKSVMPFSGFNGATGTNLATVFTSPGFSYIAFGAGALASSTGYFVGGFLEVN